MRTIDKDGEHVTNFLNWNKICGVATKQINKPSVYISNGLEFTDVENDEEIWKFICDEIRRIYPDVDKQRDMLSNINQGGLFFFDTEEEQQVFYKIFEQPLTDSSAIYACTYNRAGQCLTENT